MIETVVRFVLVAMCSQPQFILPGQLPPTNPPRTPTPHPSTMVVDGVRIPWVPPAELTRTPTPAPAPAAGFVPSPRASAGGVASARWHARAAAQAMRAEHAKHRIDATGAPEDVAKAVLDSIASFRKEPGSSPISTMEL